MQHGVAEGASRPFPKELRGSFFSNVEPRFVGLFGGMLLLVGGTVFGLSFIKPSNTVSEQQILKIQERYASIVLNQPKPKEEPKPDESKAAAKGAKDQEGAGKEEAAPTEKVDRKKETFVERTQRREASASQRAAKREAVGKQIASSGIFAAITAAGGSGGSGSGSSVSDLLGGASDAIGDLQNISVSKGTFAAANDGFTAQGVKEARRGTRTQNVEMEKTQLARAEGTQIAAVASVNLTTKPPEITDQSGAAVATGSKSCIQSVITRETPRVKRVFESWLKRDPTLSGSLEVRFTIMPDGTVSGIAVRRSSMNNPSFESNVIRYIERWSFASCGLGEQLEIVVPFAFEAAQSE